jgi:DNA polymerase III alpha subunit
MQKYSQLVDRRLWYDGVSEVDPDQLPTMIIKGAPLDRLAVTSITKDVQQLNKINDYQLALKQEVGKHLPSEWSLPADYKYLNLDDYLINLADKVKRDELYDERLTRLALEIELFETMGMMDIIRTLIFIVDEMTRKNVLWGVGRGSSCSSYLLYLIGLHEVDVVKFDIPITDFIHT